MIRIILTVILTLAIAILNFIAPVSATDLEQGAAIFEANCAGCHINGGNIVRRGKNLKQKALKRNNVDNLATVVELVTNGKNNMSAYRDRLTPQEIEEVSAYVLQQAANNWRL
jgi:cytochrome c6